MIRSERQEFGTELHPYPIYWPHGRYREKQKASQNEALEVYALDTKHQTVSAGTTNLIWTYSNNFAFTMC